MVDVVFDPDARQDLTDIYDYIAAGTGQQAARAYVTRLRRFCLSLETFPHRGRRRDDLRPGLRLLGYHRQATIAFRIEIEQITILRIYAAGRDIKP